MPTVTYGAVQTNGGGGGGAGVASLTITTPVNYGIADTLTASTSNTLDTIKLNYCTGSGACTSWTTFAVNSVGTGTASNTICDTTPSMSNCWAAGTYNIIANDITSGSIASNVLTISTAPQVLAWTAQCPTPSISWGTSNPCTTTASVTTLGSQTTATGWLNGANQGTTQTALSWTLATNVVGPYAFVFNSPATANYAVNSITYSTNIYVSVYLLNITPGSSTQSTKTLTPGISPFTWNTFYPIKIYTTSPSNLITYTLTQGANTLQSNSLNLTYIPPSNSATGTYLYSIGEFQSSSSEYMTANANKLNMTDIASTPSCTGAIRYFPNTCNAPAWNVKPASYTIVSDVAGNQHPNQSNPNVDVWSNANLTFLPKWQLTYSGFPMFTANQLNNPAINSITQTQFKFLANTIAPNTPYTRVLLNLSSYDQRTFLSLNAITTTLLTALFNNYTLSNQTSLNASAFKIYMPLSTISNPTMSITSLTLSSQANSHFLALNNYCPVVLGSGSFMTLKPYLVDLNGSLYTINIYAGYSDAGTGDYMWVMDGISNITAINVQQYQISSTPFAMALENGGSYSFRFYNAQCKFLSATNYSIWSNPININIPQNSTVPIIKIANVTTACTKNPINANIMSITCTGVDTQSLVTSWNIQLYNASYISGWTSFNSINIGSSSFSQTYPSLSNVSALQVRITDYGPGFSYTSIINFNQNSIAASLSLAARGFICLLFLLVGLGLGTAGASAGAVEAIHVPSTTCVVEALMLSILWLSGISNFIPPAVNVILILALIYIAVQAHRHESNG